MMGAPQQQMMMSQSSHVVKQRVPSSEDFPALGGGSVGSLRESVGSLGASVVVVGKTAAQVLSGPAPERAKVALGGGKKMAAQQQQQQKKKKVEEDARSTQSSSSSAEVRSVPSFLFPRSHRVASRPFISFSLSPS